MTKNPTVGPQDLAIPNSPYGVILLQQTVEGSVYGLESIIGGVKDEDNLQRPGFDMQDTTINGGLYFRGARIFGQTNIIGSSIGEKTPPKGRQSQYPLDFSRSQLEGITIRDTYAKVVILRDAKITGYAIFNRLGSEEEPVSISLQNSTVEGWMSFEGTHLNSLDLSGASLYVVRAGDSRINDTKPFNGTHIRNLYAEGTAIFNHAVNFGGLKVENFRGLIAAPRITGAPQSGPYNLFRAIDGAETLYAKIQLDAKQIA